MESEARKSKTVETFNTVSAGYDNPSLRFFSESARHMARYLDAPDIRRVLDVATGTGNLALEIARTFPEKQVTGIDFSSGMLAQARAKADGEGIRNAEFLEMDMHEIAFPDGHFDAGVCAFGVFFAEDMTKQLRHMAAKVRPGGKVVVSCFYEDSFQPLVEILGRLLERYGIERPPLKWRLIATEQKCEALFRDSGLEEIRVEHRDLGCYLEGSSQWWDVVWNAGFRTQIGRLSPRDLKRFKEEHLTDIEKLRTGKGIWLNVKILYTAGTTSR
ncbi:MAG: methyltransferase domain-containing protein [Candidatus Sulfobium sp.]|jgi:ubiquinone/menaquinone biosynthesis C-methylase UbiE